MNHHLDVADRKEAGPAAQRSFVPVVIDAGQQCDHVSLAERELRITLRLEVVQSLRARTVTRTPA